MKTCTKCKKVKKEEEFYKSSCNKDGIFSLCIKCYIEIQKKYYQKYRKEILRRQKKYNEKNREKIRKYKKKWQKGNKENINKRMNKWRKKHKQEIQKAQKKYIKGHRWYKHYNSAEQRCNNPNNVNYKNYGGRGIKFLMIVEDFKYLWFRDKAYNLERPSIDRIDNDGDYTLENCQFIELTENRKKQHNYR